MFEIATYCFFLHAGGKLKVISSVTMICRSTSDESIITPPQIFGLLPPLYLCTICTFIDHISITQRYI